MVVVWDGWRSGCHGGVWLGFGRDRFLGLGSCFGRFVGRRGFLFKDTHLFGCDLYMSTAESRKAFTEEDLILGPGHIHSRRFESAGSRGLLTASPAFHSNTLSASPLFPSPSVISLFNALTNSAPRPTVKLVAWLGVCLETAGGVREACLRKWFRYRAGFSLTVRGYRPSPPRCGSRVCQRLALS